MDLSLDVHTAVDKRVLADNSTVAGYHMVADALVEMAFDVEQANLKGHHKSRKMQFQIEQSCHN